MLLNTSDRGAMRTKKWSWSQKVDWKDMHNEYHSQSKRGVEKEEKK